MYQGKFDSKNKKTSTDVQELLAQRNAAPARKAAPVTQPEQKLSAAEASGKKRDKKAEAPEKKEKKGPRMGTLIFYTFYFTFIFLFFVGTYFGLQWLQGWLYDYEAAQPTTKCQEVFEQLFNDPDWSALYDMAGIQDTEYEGKEEFVSYMENRVGETDLTFLETSAGLSLDKKYIVNLDGEKIATFTLVDKSENKTDIPEWELGGVELFYERQESFRIQLGGNHTAYVNGVKLDDSFTVQIATTRAEKSGLLPIGVSGTGKTYTQQIDGLMAVPTVTVMDKTGADVPVSYDEVTKTFMAQTESNTVSAEHQTLALDAIKAYAEFQIKEATRAKLAKYFETSGEAYKNITGTVLDWTKDNRGYSFSNDRVTGYARYTDTLFSVYVSTEMTINLLDGGTQVKPINATLLFEEQNDKWKVIRMTNVDISEPMGEVRLTFMNGDEVLDSRFVANDADELVTPMVSAPEGKVFVGWIAKVVGENGQVEWNLIFTPDEMGNVTVSSGTVLEPMTLYAHFENAAAEGAE